MSAAAAASPGVLGHEVLPLAIEACPSGMVIVDADSIVMVNREIERIFGYSRDELLGRPIRMLLPEGIRTKQHVQQPTSFAATPSACLWQTDNDYKGRRKDGSEFPVEVRFNAVHADDERMLIGTIVDISERKRLEQVQDEFVCTVSHELRTPLTAIAASLGLIRVSAAGRLPQQAAHLLEIAEANCQRLVRMVNDLLDMKKLDAGQMSFNFQRCEAHTLLTKAVEANQGLAASRGVGVQLDVAAQSAVLYVDPDRFIQVITNLLSNALKFSPDDEDVVVTLETRGDNVRVGVRDRGAGIPAEFRPRIFESFAQANGAVGEKGGSGLGLSIARRIVTGLHGQIGFEDAEGGGTMFYVELPNAGHLARWRDGHAASPPRASIRVEQRGGFPVGFSDQGKSGRGSRI
jgi:PAS domain S-box-containing protein